MFCLYDRKFNLVTDHRYLTLLFSIKDLGSRLARWRIKLEDYDYEIVHKLEKYKKNADALSLVSHFQECSKMFKTNSKYRIQDHQQQSENEYGKLTHEYNR